MTEDGADAKFWLLPAVAVEYNFVLSARAQADLMRIVEARRGEIEEAWDEHFG